MILAANYLHMCEEILFSLVTRQDGINKSRMMVSVKEPVPPLVPASSSEIRTRVKKIRKVRILIIIMMIMIMITIIIIRINLKRKSNIQAG